MRKYLLLFFIIISSFSRACANLNPRTFECAAEWLYMLDSIDRPFYAIDDLNFIPGTEHAVKQTWHAGYRLEASRQFCEIPAEILVRWTHFPQFSNSNSADGMQFLEIGVGISHSSIRTNFNFYRLELLNNYYIFQNPCFSIEFETGLQQAQIRFKERVEGSDPNTVFIKNRSKRWGIGPEIGLEINYALWKCLVFEGRAEASLLAARKKTHAFENLNRETFVDLESKRYWLVIPSFDLRLGLEFNRCINDCFDLKVEAGYEFMTYLKGLDRFFSFGDRIFYMNFTLHGPFVRLGIAF